MIFLGYLVNYFCLFNENMQISENRLSSCPFILVSTRVPENVSKLEKSSNQYKHWAIKCTYNHVNHVASLAWLNYLITFVTN